MSGLARVILANCPGRAKAAYSEERATTPHSPALSPHSPVYDPLLSSPSGRDFVVSKSRRQPRSPARERNAGNPGAGFGKRGSGRPRGSGVCSAGFSNVDRGDQGSGVCVCVMHAFLYLFPFINFLGGSVVLLTRRQDRILRRSIRQKGEQRSGRGPAGAGADGGAGERGDLTT